MRHADWRRPAGRGTAELRRRPHRRGGGGDRRGASRPAPAGWASSRSRGCSTATDLPRPRMAGWRQTRRRPGSGRGPRRTGGAEGGRPRDRSTRPIWARSSGPRGRRRGVCAAAAGWTRRWRARRQRERFIVQAMVEGRRRATDRRGRRPHSSVRSSHAGPAASRPSCSRTWPCGSAR